MEQASKIAQTHIINDPAVMQFMDRVVKPNAAKDIDLSNHTWFLFSPPKDNPVQHLVAVDSGFTQAPLQEGYPSSALAFFQFGALTFSVADLEALEQAPFIDPEDMSKLKRIERFKLVLPVRNAVFKDQSTLTGSVRSALHQFFCQVHEGTTLLETLKWFLFEEYGKPADAYELANCPECHQPSLKVERAAVGSDGRFPCSKCGASLYLIDVFRLHEAIEDEIGAGGILGYVTTLLEQIVLAHFVRLLLGIKPSLLRHLLFIKDGPLAFFGQTANMHKKMRALVTHLLAQHDLFLAGLEKSGAFVEHAAELAEVLPDGAVLILDNDYIYKYIIPGKADDSSAYGRTTYYSAKVIFKSRQAGLYVITVPTVEPLLKPQRKDLKNLDTILANVEKLRCDMFDDALIPVALVNKLVSLANHPSSKILGRFAVEAVK